jgi:predicted acyltransferase
MPDSPAVQSTDLTTQRLWSLDTLRGFDMFWIIGGDAFFRTVAKMTDWGWADAMAVQLTHVKWDGLRAYDMIFPLFMFIAGVAIPYAQGSRRQRGASRADIVRKVLIRAFVLVLLGMVCNRILNFNFENFRWPSVLGQIGLAYLFASLIVLFTKTFKARAAWLLGILAGYAAVQLFVPVPGIGAGVLTPEGCINGYIDRMILPGRLYGTVDGVQYFDPEGILCIVSATGITLMGALAGLILRRADTSGTRKTLHLAAAGVVFLGIGLAIAPWYPPIKAAWTTTFNLQAGGISMLLLAAFYYVIDVQNFRGWTFVFRVIGLNAIIIYMAPRIIDFRHAAEFLFNGLASLSDTWQPLILIAAILTLKWLFLYFLYRKKIFLRV